MRGLLVPSFYKEMLRFILIQSMILFDFIGLNQIDSKKM